MCSSDLIPISECAFPRSPEPIHRFWSTSLLLLEARTQTRSQGCRTACANPRLSSQWKSDRDAVPCPPFPDDSPCSPRYGRRASPLHSSRAGSQSARVNFIREEPEPIPSVRLGGATKFCFGSFADVDGVCSRCQLDSRWRTLLRPQQTSGSGQQRTCDRSLRSDVSANSILFRRFRTALTFYSHSLRPSRPCQSLNCLQR